jgi:hypothetical protein
MNERLHLAAILWSRGIYYKNFREALHAADDFAKLERETRPKCEHKRRNRTCYIDPKTRHPVCPDCGEVAAAPMPAHLSAEGGGGVSDHEIRLIARVAQLQTEVEALWAALDSDKQLGTMNYVKVAAEPAPRSPSWGRLVAVAL